MRELKNSAKCLICGAGPEGLTRYDGKSIISVCEFRGDLQCPQCKELETTFFHDDVIDSEVWRVCGNCFYMEHIG
jgi:hypothetical protein